MFTSTVETSWFVLNAKPRLLKKIIETLNKKHLEYYCPFLAIHRNWDDRKRNNQQIFFPSFIFVKEEAIQQGVISKMQGGANLVYWLNEPAKITTDEVNSIKLFLNKYQKITFEKSEVNIGEKIKIVKGSAIRRDGNIVHVSGAGVLKMELPSIGYNLIAQLLDNQEYGNISSEVLLPENARSIYNNGLRNVATS
ncbi:MAG: transcription termination/antitermination NusG family protein [Agriterribacter sp.]